MSQESSNSDVRERLIASAIKMMSQQAPSSITGRELAGHAEVNYGQIHHYFGTKYDVFRAAIDNLVQDYIAGINSSKPPEWVSVDALRQQQPVWKVLAQFALDDKARAQIQWPYTVLRRALRQQAGDVPSRELRQIAAMESAFTFGWIVFEPLLREAYDLDEADMAQTLARFRELVAPPEPAGE